MATAKNRTHRVAADQKLIDGVKQHQAQFASVSVDGQTLTSAGIVALVQARIDAVKAVADAEAALRAAVKTERDGRVKSSTFRSALVRLIVGMFLSSPDTLAAFGLVAPKVAKKKVAVKAEALVKNKATREARHTMGKTQKKAIKGSPATPGNGTPAHPATPTSQV